MQSSATEDDAGLGLGDVEVADELADNGVGAGEESSISREGVDQLEDVYGVLQLGAPDRGSADAWARGVGRGRIADRCGRAEDGHRVVLRTDFGVLPYPRGEVLKSRKQV